MSNELIVWVCKSCGRAIKSREKPNFCYSDRTSSIENLSDGDSIKMGLFSTAKGTPLHRANREGDLEATIIIEFLGDLRYDPFTGEPFPAHRPLGSKLADFQNEIMRKVLSNE